MARIRTIKPSFWADDSVNRLSWDARLVLIALISFADDRGRFIATKTAVCGYAFPYEDITTARFNKLMREIEKVEIIELYAVDGRPLGRFPKWTHHQKISHPQASTLPDMPGDNRCD